MIEASEVVDKLKQSFPESDIELIDLTGTKDHYQVRIVSAAFEGKTPVEQHRMVYSALGELIHGPIHALAMQTYTPASWERRKAKEAAPNIIDRT